MMSVYKSLRLAVAGSLVLAMPLQAGTAAVRASSAVPTGSTIERCTQRDHPEEAGYCARDEAAVLDGGHGVAWPAIGVIIAAIGTAVVIESHNGKGRGNGFSR